MVRRFTGRAIFTLSIRSLLLFLLAEQVGSHNSPDVSFPSFAAPLVGPENVLWAG
jgi:hypothetical protein